MSLSQILHRQLRWVGIHSSTAWPGASWGSGGSWWEKCMKCYRLHSWVFSKRCVRRKIFKLYTYIIYIYSYKMQNANWSQTPAKQSRSHPHLQYLHQSVCIMPAIMPAGLQHSARDPYAGTKDFGPWSLSANPACDPASWCFKSEAPKANCKETMRLFGMHRREKYQK